MTLKELLNTMAQRAFSQEFIGGIVSFYDQEISKTAYDSISRDYHEALAQLEHILDEQQKADLNDIMQSYEMNLSYAASFGFKSGLFGAFRQYFTGNIEKDGGFQSLLVCDLFMQPKMQRHAESYNRSTHCLQLQEKLSSSLSKEENEYLISIDCAWSNRIYNAALQGFCCGYHAAYDVISQLKPLDKQQNISQILTMEYALGFIQSYAEMAGAGSL